MRTLGLDIGEKRIGVAVSDSEGILATALTVIERKSDDTALNNIIALAEEHDVERIVVGLPISLDGKMGPQAQRVQSFTDALNERTELPVITWDERFSTSDADRVLMEAGLKRDKRKKHLDSVAAAFILQGYIDQEKGSR
jgi:putative Holliday junction resolvase